MGQEETEIQGKGKKRMIMVTNGVKTGERVLREKVPDLHQHIQTCTLTIFNYLKRELGLEYYLSDITLLKNGENGSGDQFMHVDDKSSCDCNVDSK